MKNQLSSQCSYANLGDASTNSYHLEQHWQGLCSKGRIDETFKDIPNVFGNADDILVAGYEADGKHHDEIGQRVL